MRSDLSVVRGTRSSRGMQVFRVCAALFFIFCFFSCGRESSPVVYEIIIPTDIYVDLSGEGIYRQGKVAQFYSEKVAREVFSSDKYCVIVVDEAAEIVSPKKKPENVFVLAKVSYAEEKSAALTVSLDVFGTDWADSARVVDAGARGWTDASFAAALGEATGWTCADDVQDSVSVSPGLSAEIARTYFYPCVPFAEDGSTGMTPKFYQLSDIPMGYVIIPIRAKTASGGTALYADEPGFPFYESKLLKCDFLPAEDVCADEANLPNKPDARDAVLDESARVVCAALFNEELLPLVKQEPEPQPDVFFVAAVGDIILSRGVQDAMLNADSPDPVFTDTIPILKNNDFTIGNLEGAVTARTENAQKTYTFKFKKAALPYLKEVGFDYFMLTNNHCYDYGEPGFKDTLAAVAAAGFATSGAGLDKDAAMQFYRTTLNGHAVSVLSFGAYPVERSGFNGKTMAAATDERAGILWESDEVLDMIREEKKTGALIIVNIHGGSEYVTKPTKSQRTLYEKVCDAGADVIFGSHPHVLQPIEWYGDSLIVWSLGNFVFPGMDEMPGATDTMIVRLGFVDGRLLYYEKFPAYIDNTAVRLKK